jgi:hypothetical protein
MQAFSFKEFSKEVAEISANNGVKQKTELTKSRQLRLLLATSHPAQLSISGEVRSIPTLFQLKAGVRWFLGQDLILKVKSKSLEIGECNLILTERN